MDDTIKLIEQKAMKIRRDIVEMIGAGNKGHYGGSLSCTDIVSTLYFYKMKHDPSDPKMYNRDRLLLSKGHSALAQYAALAECGYFDRKELLNLKKLGAMLQGHPDMLKTPGIEANTGSLGQGLSIANGMALGGRLDNNPFKVYVIMGDGEIAEGQVWEAAMASSCYKLNNVVAILDRNSLQAMGRTEDRFDISPINEKWQAFGWNVIQIDGHDVKQIIKALDDADSSETKPTIIIALTTKGKGLSCTENVVGFHNGEMNLEQYEKALQELCIL